MIFLLLILLSIIQFSISKDEIHLGQDPQKKNASFGDNLRKEVRERQKADNFSKAFNPNYQNHGKKAPDKIHLEARNIYDIPIEELKHWPDIYWLEYFENNNAPLQKWTLESQERMLKRFEFYKFEGFRKFIQLMPDYNKVIQKYNKIKEEDIRHRNLKDWYIYLDQNRGNKLHIRQYIENEARRARADEIKEDNKLKLELENLEKEISNEAKNKTLEYHQELKILEDQIKSYENLSKETYDEEYQIIYDQRAKALKNDLQSQNRLINKQYSLDFYTQDYLKKLNLNSDLLLNVNGTNFQHQLHNEFLEIIKKSNLLQSCSLNSKIKNLCEINTKIAFDGCIKNQNSQIKEAEAIADVSTCLYKLCRGIYYASKDKIFDIAKNPIETIKDNVLFIPRLAVNLCKVVKFSLETAGKKMGIYQPGIDYFQTSHELQTLYDNIYDFIKNAPVDQKAEQFGRIIGNLAIDYIITKKLAIPTIIKSKEILGSTLKKIPNYLGEFGEAGKETAGIIKIVTDKGIEKVEQATEFIQKNPEKINREQSISKNVENIVENNVKWGFWRDLPKITKNNREYAKIGNYLYSHHAIDRMTPKNFGESFNVTDSAGRGIPTIVVEDVLKNGQIVRSNIKEGAEQIVKKLRDIEVVLEDNIILSVMKK